MRPWLLLFALACGGTDTQEADSTPGAEDGGMGDADDGGSEDGGSEDGDSEDGDDSAGGDTGTPVDTGDPVDEACRDVPLITYASFGQGFLTFNCQGCHGSASPARQGAPESVTFDDHDQALTWLARIYARTYESRDMPPALGIFDDDIERLRIWIECWDGQ